MRRQLDLSLAVHFAQRQFDLDRLEHFVVNLRSIEGVGEVLVHSTDERGRSMIRVVTDASAADLATALKNLGNHITVRSTKHRVEVKAEEPRFWSKKYKFVAIGVVVLAFALVLISARSPRR